ICPTTGFLLPKAARAAKVNHVVVIICCRLTQRPHDVGHVPARQRPPPHRLCTSSCHHAKPFSQPRRSTLMAKGRGDFTDVLIRRKLISADQLTEAENLASSTGIKLQDAFLKLQTLSAVEIMQAVAEHHGVQFVDLGEMEIPRAVIELVPESVARENVVLPLALEGNQL